MMLQQSRVSCSHGWWVDSWVNICVALSPCGSAFGLSICDSICPLRLLFSLKAVEMQKPEPRKGMKSQTRLSFRYSMKELRIRAFGRLCSRLSDMNWRLILCSCGNETGFAGSSMVPSDTANSPPPSPG